MCIRDRATGEYFIKSPEDFEQFRKYQPSIGLIDTSQIEHARAIVGQDGLACTWVKGAFNIAEALSLIHISSMYMHDLSASQCQMVSIARALSRNPKILILDEPTSPLTENEVEALFKILSQLR